MIVGNIDVSTIRVKVRGHTYVIRGRATDREIAEAIRSWTDNPELDFDVPDGIAMATFLDTLRALCNC